MRKSLKVILVVLSITTVAVVSIVIAYPEIAATRYGYLDINNGRKKLEWVSFGRVYRTSIQDTEYSILLKNLGFGEKSPDWKLSSQEEFGLLRLFRPQFVDYDEGKIDADTKNFALTIKLKELSPEKARELTTHFQELIKKGDYLAVRDYTKLVEKGE